jgi:hypothetical protein
MQSLRPGIREREVCVKACGTNYLTFKANGSKGRNTERDRAPP